jgi:thiamine kinase-like enzyme
VLPSDEHPSLELLEPVPEELLQAWLREFYGKTVRIKQRAVLRHRDLSYVERLHIADSLPQSLIYKLVLPPWDIEQDLHERVLIPSISNSAQLYLSAHHNQVTALFLEDLGSRSLTAHGSRKIASRLGADLARMHRSYSYRTDELLQTGVLRNLLPIDYIDKVRTLNDHLSRWGLGSQHAENALLRLAQFLALKLAGEPTSLVHGDLFAENIIIRGDRLWIIDWSWFAMVGVPLLDLATITMDHFKNGKFTTWRNDVIEAYCDESARNPKEMDALLPCAEALNKILFLDWLVERRIRGIFGTTVGPVDNLIPQVLDDLTHRCTILM